MASLCRSFSPATTGCRSYQSPHVPQPVSHPPRSPSKEGVATRAVTTSAAAAAVAAVAAARATAHQRQQAAAAVHRPDQAPSQPQAQQSPPPRLEGRPVEWARLGDLRLIEQQFLVRPSFANYLLAWIVAPLAIHVLLGLSRVVLLRRLLAPTWRRGRGGGACMVDGCGRKAKHAAGMRAASLPELPPGTPRPVAPRALGTPPCRSACICKRCLHTRPCVRCRSVAPPSA